MREKKKKKKKKRKNGSSFPSRAHAASAYRRACMEKENVRSE
jgi:hypothetical protein